MRIQDNIQFATITLANFTANGAIGTAATTVNQASCFIIPQTTANITLTIPNPTDTLASTTCRIINTGSVAFTMYNTIIAPNKFEDFNFDGISWKSNKGKIPAFAVAPTLVIAGFTSPSSLVGVYLRSTDKTITYRWFIIASIAIGTAGWKTFVAPTIAGYSTGDIKCSTYRTTNFTGYPPAPYMAQEVCENYGGGATSYILTSTAPTVAQTIYLSLEITYTLN